MAIFPYVTAGKPKAKNKTAKNQYIIQLYCDLYFKDDDLFISVKLLARQNQHDDKACYSAIQRTEAAFP